MNPLIPIAAGAAALLLFGKKSTSTENNTPDDLEPVVLPETPVVEENTATDPRQSPFYFGDKTKAYDKFYDYNDTFSQQRIDAGYYDDRPGEALRCRIHPRMLVIGKSQVNFVVPFVMTSTTPPLNVFIPHELICTGTAYGFASLVEVFNPLPIPVTINSSRILDVTYNYNKLGLFTQFLTTAKADNFYKAGAMDPLLPLLQATRIKPEGTLPTGLTVEQAKAWAIQGRIIPAMSSTMIEVSLYQTVPYEALGLYKRTPSQKIPGTSTTKPTLLTVMEDIVNTGGTGMFSVDINLICNGDTTKEYYKRLGLFYGSEPAIVPEQFWERQYVGDNNALFSAQPDTVPNLWNTAKANL